MNKKALQASYDCFGLKSDASINEVERSFRELRALYNGKSLAIYSLMDEAERQEKLASLQASFDLILQARPQTRTVGVDRLRAVKDEMPSDSGSKVLVDADPKKMPGLFLKQTRMALGISLREVAERTKISSHYLQSIEDQNFADLPAPVYLRGFIKEFARLMNIPDFSTLIDSFMELYQNEEKEDSSNY